jgi:hypothetical protein
METNVRSVGVYLSFSFQHQLPIHALQKPYLKYPSKGDAVFKTRNVFTCQYKVPIKHVIRPATGPRISSLIGACSQIGKVPDIKYKYGLV